MRSECGRSPPSAEEAGCAPDTVQPAAAAFGGPAGGGEPGDRAPRQHVGIMLGSVMETDFGRHIKQPDEIGGCETQSAYIIVKDADVIYQRATAAGA